MYLRTMTRHNADGSTVRYLQLAHNRWDPKTKRAQAVVIHNFGREDRVDPDAIRRLIHSLARVLPPGTPRAPQARPKASRSCGPRP